LLRRQKSIHPIKKALAQAIMRMALRVFGDLVAATARLFNIAVLRAEMISGAESCNTGEFVVLYLISGNSSVASHKRLELLSLVFSHSRLGAARLDGLQRLSAAV
jgi:hypothetical protein